MCTALQVGDTRVVQVKTKEKDGYDAVQLGTGFIRPHKTNRAQLGHFTKWGNELPTRFLKEFRVTPECLLPVGAKVGARHFVPGQHVDIQGIT